MTPKEFRKILRQTLQDQRLSRSERRALSAVLEEIRPPSSQLDLYRHEAFDLARDELNNALDHRSVLEWLEEVVKRLKPSAQITQEIHAEAYFSPGSKCRNRIQALLRNAKDNVDICVFTITDNEITEEIAAAHNRGVHVRIVTDDEKSSNTGSDIYRLQDHGVDVRIDATRHHMHHKFAIFDSEYLLTGSYNWTRSAADHNEENILVINEPSLIKKFSKLYEELWEKFGH